MADPLKHKKPRHPTGLFYMGFRVHSECIILQRAHCSLIWQV